MFLLSVDNFRQSCRKWLIGRRWMRGGDWQPKIAKVVTCRNYYSDFDFTPSILFVHKFYFKGILTLKHKAELRKSGYLGRVK